MPNQSEQSRRDFMKLAAAGATTLTFGTMEATAGRTGTSGWVNGQRINPAIPNTLVVYCIDQAMIKSTPSSNWSFENQNKGIETAKVEENMDKLAMRLTGAASAVQAWKTIFMKPAAKSDFSTVKVAIKVNCIWPNGIMPRIAIVGKVCKELMKLGVAAGNITLYDSGHGASGNEKYTPYINNGLPQGVKVLDTKQNGPEVPVGSGTYQCSPAIAKLGANGIEYVADILVNCAVNKGHNWTHGGFTMTMKNHTGTLKYSCPANDDLINENKSEAIIGTMGDPAKPPRQQLCIIDSLWAATDGPTEPVTHSPATIAMGTVGPVVDYAVAENVRKKMMNADYNTGVVNKWLTSFGIDKDQIQWADALVSVGAHEVKPSLDQRVLLVRVQGREGSQVSFHLPENADSLRVDILTIDGKVVCRMKPSGAASELHAIWDGRLPGGKGAPAGRYIVRLRCGSETMSRNIHLF